MFNLAMIAGHIIDVLMWMVDKLVKFINFTKRKEHCNEKFYVNFIYGSVDNNGSDEYRVMQIDYYFQKNRESFLRTQLEELQNLQQHNNIK